MKYIYLSAFFFVLCFSACRKNSDIIEPVVEEPTTEPVPTINLSWSAHVTEMEGLWRWGDFLDNSTLHNVSVKLMFKGNVLWESNTDRRGGFSFQEQPVPAEGAYFLFEAPGYHNNIVQVQGESIPLWRVHMIRNTFPDVKSEKLTGAESYITLTGQLQDPSTLWEAWFYLTNADNELLGTSVVDPENPSFYMTTLPNEELFLHYNVDCGGDVIALGSFSESENIGPFVDQSIDFSIDFDQVSLRNVNDCSTGTKLYGYDLFYKQDNFTFQAGGNSGFSIFDCQFVNHPILLSVATQNPRKYVEVAITHTSGQRTIAPDQEACEDDDTFLKYRIGPGAEEGGDIFTVANILPDGQMVMKQAEHPLNGDNRLTLTFDGATTGNHNCDLNLVIRYYNSNNSWSNGNSLGGHMLNAIITKNDGTFVEGTFSGEVLDTEEVSLGNVEGTFRARIQ